MLSLPWPLGWLVALGPRVHTGRASRGCGPGTAGSLASVTRNQESALWGQVSWEQAGCGVAVGLGRPRHQAQAVQSPREKPEGRSARPVTARWGQSPGRPGAGDGAGFTPCLWPPTLGKLLSAAADWGLTRVTCGKACADRGGGGWQVPATVPLLSCPCCPRKKGRRGLTMASPEASWSVSPVPGSLSDRPFCFRARTTVLCARARFTPRTRTPRTRSCTRATST